MKNLTDRELLEEIDYCVKFFGITILVMLIFISLCVILIRMN